MSNSYEEFMKHSFKVLAPVYDPMMRVFSGGRSRVVDVAAFPAGSRVLDVATGTGQQAFAFADAGCEVVGIDFSEDMIRQAEKKNRYARVRFMVEDATDLSFDEDEFDHAVISIALHEMPLEMRLRTLNEIKRVTRAGGTIVAVDYDLTADNSARRLICGFFKLFESSVYNDFSRFDLDFLFGKCGIDIVEDVPLCYKTVKILKGTNSK